MPFEAAVERLAGRRWRTERREGVEHYVTGQHVAIACDFGPPDGPADEQTGASGPGWLLAYVHRLGHQVLVVPVQLYPVARPAWQPVGVAIWLFGIRHGDVEALPENFELSEAMVKALEAAR